MINLEKELRMILENDPLGLLQVKPKVSSTLTADERLISSFDEINSFMREHGREPTESRDISERKLFSRLKGLRESPEKAQALKGYDSLGLLKDVAPPKSKEIKSIEDVLENDVLGLLDSQAAEEADPNEIFVLRNVPKVPKMPDYIAKRKACAEFAQFEPLFKKCQSDLSARIKVTQPFNSERQIEPGAMFISQGMLVYVANQGKWEKKNFGNVNARLYCVFENGTESTLLLRSLAAALWKDKTSRQVIDADQMEIVRAPTQLSKDDKATGYIYVLRSLSEDPKISSISDLYKIGYSTEPARQRIQNAELEATYLMADVIPVAEFKTFNLNPQKLELLLHRFFAETCLNLDIFDADGKRYTPREWFIVPLHVIEQAIGYLISGEIVEFRYDPGTQEIVRK